MWPVIEFVLVLFYHSACIVQSGRGPNFLEPTRCCLGVWKQCMQVPCRALQIRVIDCGIMSATVPNHGVYSCCSSLTSMVSHASDKSGRKFGRFHLCRRWLIHDRVAYPTSSLDFLSVSSTFTLQRLPISHNAGGRIPNG